MRHTIASLLLLGCSLLPTTSMGAPSLPPPAAVPSASASLVQQAEQAFDKGEFAAAAAAYEQLVQAGTINGHLFYNLGTAYYRLGQVGHAMAAFLGARRYLPRDPDTAANLRFVLATVHDKLDAETAPSSLRRTFFWLNRFTLRELAWAAAGLVGLWGLLMTAALVVPRLQRARWSVLATALLPALAVASMVAKAGEAETWGAVVGPEAKVYSGPGTLNAVVFELHAGAPVLVTEAAAGGYYRIQLSDGKRGWIADREVKVFGPI